MLRELEIIKQVLLRKKYFLLFLISSLITFFVFYFLTLWEVTDKSLKIFIEMNGYNYAFLTLLLLGIIALLLGVYVAIFAFKTSEFRENSDSVQKSSISDIKLTRRGKLIGFSGFLGFIAGLLSSGCPMCGSVIFALLGFPLALFFLPFKGLELRLLSIILLLFSVYFLAKSFVRCELKK